MAILGLWKPFPSLKHEKRAPLFPVHHIINPLSSLGEVSCKQGQSSQNAELGLVFPCPDLNQGFFCLALIKAPCPSLTRPNPQVAPCIHSLMNYPTLLASCLPATVMKSH